MQVTEIWFNHLKHLVANRTKAPDTTKGFGPLADMEEDEEGLGRSCDLFSALINYSAVLL